MTKFLSNPVQLLLSGSLLIGLGIDMDGKAIIISPGIVLLFVGLVLGVKWLSER